MHSEDQRVLNLIHSIYERFKTADNVAFEVLMDMPTMTKSANTIDVSHQRKMDRFMETLNQIKSGSNPPPIIVQLGSRGVNIEDVNLDSIGE